MHPAYVRIDVAALRRMYVDERMTTTEIARGLKCGGSTVIRRLREIGIPRRPRGPSLALRRRGVAVHPEWSPDVAWVVGLIATDGNLAGTGRSLSITSKDLDLLESARRCLALSNRLVRVRSHWGSCGYRLQWRNRAFYDWLIAIGPTPRKSLTIGLCAFRTSTSLTSCAAASTVTAPSSSIWTATMPAARSPTSTAGSRCRSCPRAGRSSIGCGRRSSDCSASRGGVGVKWTPLGRPVWNLRYAKRASVRLLRWMYHSPNVPGLARKRAKAEPFLCGPE
jgi:hypothetical protein